LNRATLANTDREEGRIIGEAALGNLQAPLISASILAQFALGKGVSGVE
jgi:hypothetical protein